MLCRIFGDKINIIFLEVILLLIICIFAKAKMLCNGSFFYVLDDPYITLSLADHLAHGHYGVNAGEYSSPCSSILYPILLAPFAALPGFALMPLVINSAACIATMGLYGEALIRYNIISERGVISERDKVSAGILIVGFGIAMNLVGIIFTGLEHSLHALVSVAVVFALARVVEGERPVPWLAGALIVLPLIRFEGLALSIAGIVLLFSYGRWCIASLSVFGLVLCFGLWAILMHDLRLPFFPSSVLVKLSPFSIDVLKSKYLGMIVDFSHPNGGEVSLPFVIMTGLVAIGTWKSTRMRALGLAVLFALASHLIVGSWGWFHRYEIYGMALGTASLIPLAPGTLRRMVKRGPLFCTQIVAWAMLVGWKYVLVGTLSAPVASQSIYFQQNQMARFAQSYYRRSVGVNDLGLVSFRNPNYVLDLWGLGSESARQARMITHAPDWMNQLVTVHKVEMVMIYDSWFKGSIPKTWRPIARLRSDYLCYSCGGLVVTFFATSDKSVPRVLSAVREFAPTVPNGTIVDINDSLYRPNKEHSLDWGR